MKFRATILLLAIELSGCGGGGGGSSPMQAPADLSYPSATAFVVGTAIKPLMPTVSGTVTAYAVSPALPAGLSLNTATGAISGTPTAVAAKTTYMVTASNAVGSTDEAVTIQVWSGVLLDLGHVTPITGLQLTGSRALSQESSGRCILWDTANDARVTSFQCSGSISMAGPTIVIPGANSLQVLTASDGQVQATITDPYSWWQLAADGSYIATGSTAGLTAWSPTGQSLYSTAGDYSTAKVFAAAGQIQVALGPLGPSVIQTISVGTGASSLGPAFQGTFNEWFSDGSHYQTALSTTVWTYSSASVQQDQTTLAAVPGLLGVGNWFWVTSAGTTNIYAVGASQTPALTIPGIPSYFNIIPSGATLAFCPVPVTGLDQITIVDLSGASPVQTTYPLAISSCTAYAATSASDWYLGNSNGLLLDGTSLASTPKYLTLGTALSIASGGELVAVATASGQILVMSLQTQTVQNTFEFLAGNLQMSADGTVLAAASETGSPLNVYSLPTGTLINAWSYNYPYGFLGFTLALTGTLIAQTTADQFIPGPIPPFFAAQVTAVTGGPVLWSVPNPNSPAYPLGPNILFSPDGTLIAVPGGNETTIYQNYVLKTTLSGLAVGWIDNSRLLINNYDSPKGVFQYTEATIYSLTGTSNVVQALPQLTSLETVSFDSIYSPSANSIYSLKTGALIFGNGELLQSPLVGGTVVAGYAVFPSGSLVRAVPY